MERERVGEIVKRHVEEKYAKKWREQEITVEKKNRGQMYEKREGRERRDGEEKEKESRRDKDWKDCSLQ